MQIKLVIELEKSLTKLYFKNNQSSIENEYKNNVKVAEIKISNLKEQKRNLLAERKQILTGMGIDETQLLPQFTCKKCSDTGFLPSGTACNCYNPQ